MLHLILADAEIERIPEDIWGHPSVRKHAERRRKKARYMLLDASFHHSAIRSIYKRDSERRGRPDIAHFFLVMAHESPLNAAGLVRTYIHTRNNEVITIQPEVRVPKAYHRFVGLIESVYLNGAVPSSDNPLLKIKGGITLKELVDSISPEDTYLLDEGGTAKLKDMPLASAKDSDIAVIAGGFPEGDFISDISFIRKDRRVSIGNKPLMAYTATYEVIAQAERDLGIV